MRSYRAMYDLILCMLLAACTQTLQASTPTGGPTRTPVATSTAAPGPTAAATATRHQDPTLIPTIEAAEVPALLKNSLVIETLHDFDGYNRQRISGWPDGFNGAVWDHGSSYPSQSYVWLDVNHVLLYAATGQSPEPNWTTLSASPVVMNIHTGAVWLPPIERSLNDGRRWFSLRLPRWSPRLNVLVTAEKVGGQEGVSTFTADGQRVAHYAGPLVDISPSAEHVFIAGDTWIDLESGRKVNFGWGPGFGESVARWFPTWSRDENQIYFCCYYYGNATTGRSYILTQEDTIFDGKPFATPHALRHAYGVWLNDHVVLADYDAWWYGGPGFSAIFDVSERTYHDLGVVAALPDAFNNNTYSFKSISPSGDYMYISPGAQRESDPQIYLVDLKSLKSKLYHAAALEWSANGKFALMGSQVLTLSDQTLRTLPAQATSPEVLYWIAGGWHPTEGVHVSIYADNQQHLVVDLLDVEALTNRRRQFALHSNFEGDSYGTDMVWSPLGDRFAFAAADGSLWQMDYPDLENLRQLTPPLANVRDVFWSPDGRYVSYADGTDVYFVQVPSNP